MKKVLIITYYWPPAGGPGVQRVLKFAKYLPEFGWQPIILTVENGEYPAYDESLSKDIPTGCKVYRTRSIEPFKLYKKFTGMAENEAIPVATLTEEKKNWKKKLAHWIRLNLFIPDAKIGWIPFAVKAGKRIIKQENPDIIFSSSPPPTAHLIARKLAKWSKLKWVADFRDPWTGIHYYENKKRVFITKKIDKLYENITLARCNKIVCVSKYDIEDYFGNGDIEKCVYIPNGFDEEDFVAVDQEIKTKTDKFTILHLGAVGKERIPYNLFKSIRDLIDLKVLDKKLFRLVFIGNIEDSVKLAAEEFQISDTITYSNYLPHDEALKSAKQSDLLLLLITQSKNNMRILPGKTFEYMRLRKPIMALGPVDGAVDNILKDSASGKTIDYNDKRGISNFLTECYISWTKNELGNKYSHTIINDYSRRNLTQKIIKTFEKL